MSNTPTNEAIADIVAEMRDARYHATMLDLADRIEAAAKRDERLIAELLYLLAEDFAEAIASDKFRIAMKRACSRIGVKYEPFGPDMMEEIEKRKGDLA